MDGKAFILLSKIISNKYRTVEPKVQRLSLSYKMKIIKMKIITVITLTLLFNINLVFSQNINWRSIPEDRQSLVSLQMGFDFGLTTQLGYGRKINTFRPLFLMADVSLPMGNKPFQDFKCRAGGQMEVFEKHQFSLSMQYLTIVRRLETGLVRQLGIGSKTGLTVGYFAPKWHLAAEFGYDQFIATHIKHSDLLYSNYEQLENGWYMNTGGQWYYGLQGGKTLGNRLELTYKAGATNSKGDHVNAMLPYYLQLGLVWRF